MATLKLTDSDKLLRDFMTPATPSHIAPGTRRVTITGRVSEVLDDTVVMMYHSRADDERLVTHPRDGVQSWHAGERRMFSHLRDMEYWLEANVRAFLATARQWQAEVAPRRVLYAWGMRGSGRLTLLADFCCRARVNLLVVRRNEHVKDMFFSVYEKAEQLQPCVVYINNATSVIGSPDYTNELLAAYPKIIDSSATNVWTVLAGSHPPDKLIAGDRMAHPLYTRLLEFYGDIVHVPCLSSIGETECVAVDFLRGVAQDETYASRESQPAWGEVIDYMARAFLFHTMFEMRLFVRNVFARHNIECALKDQPIRLPGPEVFSAALKALPQIETAGQLHYKLFSRNTYKAYLDQSKAWNEYTKLVGVKPPLPPLQCNYVPSFERDAPPPSFFDSISSPTRTTSLVPRCAPERRPAKRQRELPRIHDLPSLKPLPVRSQKDTVELDFFEDV